MTTRKQKLPAPPKQERVVRDATFPVVGIGASAGGLRALQQLFANLDGETGMGFVVVVHLAPDHESHMAELLQKHTTMPVSQVTRRTKIERNAVYIIPPDRDLSLDDGHIDLTARMQPARDRAPIDLFFRTLAVVHESDAIGVVLSGTGCDGTQGIKWIHERGGLTMAQDPSDADYDGMPRSALATGLIDIEQPAPELGKSLSRVRHRVAAELREADDEGVDTGESTTIAKILTHVRVKTGHDFVGYKSATVMRRIARRLQLSGAVDLTGYLAALRNDSIETRALFNDLLVVVTSFFRDPDAVAALNRDVVPSLFAGKGPDAVVRVWVAGCATGEEAYSMAMLLCEYADKLDTPPHIQIFATDVHEHSFSLAREGLYPESIKTDVSAERLERFFTKEAGGYRVKKFIREKVLFATHNLLRDPPFLRLDLVSCRNLLIYLRRDAQQRVFESFHFALLPGAHLFLGTSETPENTSTLFVPFDKAHHIYRTVPGSQRVVPRGPASDTTLHQRPSPRQTIATTGSAAVLAALHHQLLEAHGPPSLVVNADEEVVHLSNNVGQFLDHGGGLPSNKLLDMVSGDLRLELRALLRSALRAGAPAVARNVTAMVGGVERRIALSVRPLNMESSGEKASKGSPSSNFALVVFDAASAELTTSPKAPGARTRANTKSSVARLEDELRVTKERLRTATAEHDAAMEALRGSNEELQSITEEQRAFAEELETSKEELQSINEELRTVNQEHRMRNDELAEVNSDLLNLIDSTSIATIFLDEALRIRRFTPSILELFNLVANDRGRPLADITHRLDYPEIEDDTRRVFESLSASEREVMSSSGHWFTVRITPYRTADHRVGGVVLTFIDMSDRRRAEDERAALLKRVQTADSVKANFIGVMSHEFRTPLNAILGYADILDSEAHGGMSDEQRADVRRIANNARHLAQMVNEILSSARLEAHPVGATPRWEQVDINALVRETVSSVETLANAKHLTLRVDAADSPVHVMTDITKLRQILFNLLGNAIRFTDVGGIIARILDDDREVVLEVEDTGIGIEAEHLERVFERFWQADQTLTRVRGGSGLGLMVSRSLADSIGATLQVESELGRGSVFRLRLPRV